MNYKEILKKYNNDVTDLSNYTMNNNSEFEIDLADEKIKLSLIHNANNQLQTWHLYEINLLLIDYNDKEYEKLKYLSINSYKIHIPFDTVSKWIDLDKYKIWCKYMMSYLKQFLSEKDIIWYEFR